MFKTQGRYEEEYCICNDTSTVCNDIAWSTCDVSFLLYNDHHEPNLLALRNAKKAHENTKISSS